MRIIDNLTPILYFMLPNSKFKNEENDYDKLDWYKINIDPKPTFKAIAAAAPNLILENAKINKIKELTNYYNTYKNCDIILYTKDWEASTFDMEDLPNFIAMKSLQTYILYGDDNILKVIDCTKIDPIIEVIQNRSGDNYVASVVHKKLINKLTILKDVEKYDFTKKVKWDGKQSKIETDIFKIDITDYITD